MLTLVSSISQSKKEEAVPNFGTNEEEEEDAANSDTKEKPYVPTFGRKQESNESERESAVFEELTASVLNRYLVKMNQNIFLLKSNTPKRGNSCMLISIT